MTGGQVVIINGQRRDQLEHAPAGAAGADQQAAAKRFGQNGRGQLATADIQPLHHAAAAHRKAGTAIDRKSTRLNSSHVAISYAVFCLKKKKDKKSELLTRDPTITPRRRSSNESR